MARRDRDSASLFAQDKLDAQAARNAPRTQRMDGRETMPPDIASINVTDMEFNDPGKKYASIKNPKVYEALRKKGYSKSKAARICNAQ